jgi:putative PEP-CTERM system TPR-repeat lipoprotein
MKQVIRPQVIVVSAVLLQLAACGWFTSAEERLARAEQMIARGEDRAAAIELQNALRSKPELVQARVMLANVSLRLGDPNGALKELERAVAHGATPDQIATTMVDVQLELRRYEELLSAIESGNVPLDEPARSTAQGLAHLGLGNTPAAIDDFRRALAHDPSWHRARVGLADALAAEGKLDEALTLLEDTLSADPNLASAWLAKGFLHGRRGEAREAADALERARKFAAGSLSVTQRASLLLGLADAQLASGNQTAAKDVYEELARLAPNWPLTHLLGARLSMARQDYGEAVASAHKALRAAPDLLPAKLLLGRAQYAQGSLNQAEATLSELVQQDPSNLEARKLLAEVSLRLQRPEVAMQLIGGEAADDGDPWRDALLGWANLQRGEADTAIALFERSVSAQPNDPNLKLALAAAYLAGGQSDKAITLLQSLPPAAGDSRRDQLLVAAVAAFRGKDSADREMQRIIAANPTDIATLNLGASYFIGAGDLVRARELLNRAISLEPNHTQTLMALARLQVAEGDTSGAGQTLDKVIALAPKNNAAKLLAAELAARSGDVAGAIKRLEDIRRSDPQAIQPRLQLARAYFRQKKTAEANAAIAEALAIAPGNAAVADAVGNLYREVGRFDEALASFRKAVEREPTNARYVLNLGYTQLARGDAVAARGSFEKAAALTAGSVAAIGALAMLDVREGKPEAAIARVAALKKDRPRDPAVATLEGHVAMSMKAYAAAAKAYAEALHLAPSGAAAIRVFQARQIGGLPDAVAPLEQWLSVKPDDRAVRVVLAEAYMMRGKTEEAIELYERTIAAEGPRDAVILNNLAWLYHTKGDARALPTAKAAYDRARDNPAIADTYGWILVESGDLETALPLLRDAAAAMKDQPEVRYHYAAALAKAGKVDLARRELTELLQTNGHFPSVTEAQKLLRQLAE